MATKKRAMPKTKTSAQATPASALARIALEAENARLVAELAAMRDYIGQVNRDEMTLDQETSSGWLLEIVKAARREGHPDNWAVPRSEDETQSARHLWEIVDDAWRRFVEQDSLEGRVRRCLSILRRTDGESAQPSKGEVDWMLREFAFVDPAFRALTAKDFEHHLDRSREHGPGTDLRTRSESNGQAGPRRLLARLALACGALDAASAAGKSEQFRIEVLDNRWRPYSRRKPAVRAKTPKKLAR